MKSGGSSTLNPYAASYVPLSKREGSLVGGGGAAKPSAYHHHQVQQQPHHVAQGYGVQGMGGSYPSPQVSSLPKKASDMVYNQQMKDEDLEMDMDIEFLLVTFSGLSHESINDVYLANNCDLDATIEMLNQLEIYSTEAQEYLPDTLDIGDVPETITEPSTSTASKLKNEASASSSGIHNARVSSS
ncbi:PREDICTED: polyadenylate-binding protein-interacting protein 6-like [Camelina sativa]|uniref:Polyadenylate-binding protein-interacting protein 6-like n=1 Tax=Camelina sativa TaxID=90675 RepID=A0ABM0T630_CAMSA|nr:PREDICTED: polyadenylate-binding protein-interacting protein 6-like [Camelina sativa]XP_010421412.1 PREDICTED: polyadenylate-binding protein-interacting protein 6-like [Camelina sativa]